MDINRIKIVADSSGDILEMRDVPFEAAPLKIITAQNEYVDDTHLDVNEMVNTLQTYNGKSSTSCPNVNDWIKAFGDAEWVFCVTITGALSGSYNSAMLAKNSYEELHPECKVFVLDSLTAGPEIGLIIEKLEELILAGKQFDDICEDITKYSKKTGLLFVLASMQNLKNNGRVSPLAAKMAGLLSVRVVGKASDKGDLESISKCRGEYKALETIIQNLKSLGLKKGKVRIGHCLNEAAGKQLKEKIQAEFARVQVELYRCRGLCSFYAEKGGLLIGFEKA